MSKEREGEVHNDESLKRNKIWKLFFHGESSKEGARSRVVLISPIDQTIPISYKLQFETTNNTAEYESLILGLKATKDLGVDEISTFGDSELVEHQVRKFYSVKQPKLRNYVQEVWDMIELNFSAFNITHVKREEN